MEYRFVHEGEDGRKRKAPYSACDKCKKRKVSTVSVSRVCDDRIVDLFGLSNYSIVNTGDALHRDRLQQTIDRPKRPGLTKRRNDALTSPMHLTVSSPMAKGESLSQ